MAIDHAMEPRGYVLRFRSLFSDFAPTASLAWGRSLVEFSPRLTTVGQVAGVATRLWVPEIKTEFVIVLAWDYDRASFDFQIYPSLGDLGTVLANPETARRFLNYPGAKELSEHPKILALRNDPEIAEMIAQGRMFDLLRDPRVIDAANDPTLAARAKAFDLKKALEFAAKK